MQLAMSHAIKNENSWKSTKFVQVCHTEIQSHEDFSTSCPACLIATCMHKGVMLELQVNRALAVMQFLVFAMSAVNVRTDQCFFFQLFFFFLIL